MANAAFDAWVVKFLIAVNNYNTNVGEWNAKGETKKVTKPDKTYPPILTLRTELSNILNYNPPLRLQALSSLDRIINVGGKIKNGKYQSLYIVDIKLWISKYSSLIR